MLLRHVLSEGGVATACSCRDLFSLKLTSRQLIDVATFWSLQFLSRHPDVVATSSLYNCCRDNQVLSRPYLLWNCTIFSLQANVATGHDAVLMSRLNPYVATLCLLFLQLLVV